MYGVVGAAGQLGTALCSVLGDRAVPVIRPDLDLEDIAAIAPFVADLKAEAIVNCAAYTAVDDAEQDQARARAINATAAGELARACRATGKMFATISTDYVFDGTKDGAYVESDQPHPASVYGRTKREGEILVMEQHPGALVVRTSWVMSGSHPNFAATMLRLIGEGPVRVVDDQVGHPTFVSDLAPAVIAAVEAEASGLLHLTNQGVASWFDLAREVAEIASLDPALVSPCRSEDFPRPAPRPRNSVLESERLAAFSLDPLPHYRGSLAAAVGELQAVS